jgi:hypothetical protein
LLELVELIGDLGQLRVPDGDDLGHDLGRRDVHLSDEREDALDVGCEVGDEERVRLRHLDESSGGAARHASLLETGEYGSRLQVCEADMERQVAILAADPREILGRDDRRRLSGQRPGLDHLEEGRPSLAALDQRDPVDLEDRPRDREDPGLLDGFGADEVDPLLRERLPGVVIEEALPGERREPLDERLDLDVLEVHENFARRFLGAYAGGEPGLHKGHCCNHYEEREATLTHDGPPRRREIEGLGRALTEAEIATPADTPRLLNTLS